MNSRENLERNLSTSAVLFNYQELRNISLLPLDLKRVSLLPPNSLTQPSSPVRISLIDAFSDSSGGWVLLKNVHLVPQWLVSLEKRLHCTLPAACSLFPLNDSSRSQSFIPVVYDL